MVAPTAAVTFLFTDIEGSTRLWETEPVLMAAALIRHDRLCRDIVEAQRGHVVKMLGDGLHAAFDDPYAAVAAAFELQRGVAAIDADCGVAFRMRCGLHTGVVEVRDSDYFGSVVNRAARISAAAHGGQVLLSQALVDQVAGRFADGLDVIHLGRVRLRDLASPEAVWQLTHSELRREFPALRSLDSTPNNLPQQPSTFIGREKEIAEIKTLLAGTRLLTLVGSGGCGKTRLAVQVAADLLEDFPDGVWLVELAALTDPDLVPQAVATALGVREETGKALTQTVVEHLAARKPLVVLDNTEHLLSASARFVDAVLRRCPQVTLLVSSREGLGIAGESTYRVPSLSMPDPKRDTHAAGLSAFESVRLLVERIRSHAPRFEITAHNAAALASICHRLDGIPLAIELAAARVRTLSVDELNLRLDQRFRLLTGGSRTALPRQQTLRSLIDWSHDQLNLTERVLFTRLSVFAGGFTLQAAERICSGEGVDEGDVLDLLTSLVDKSLVMAESRDATMRYRLLETIRQYARERLLEGGGGPGLRDRHLDFFLSLARQAAPQLTGPDQRAWFERLETEYDNLRAALTWASSVVGDPDAGLHLAGALWRYWYVRAHFSEGRSWLGTMLAGGAGGRSPARAHALSGMGSLAWLQSDLAAAKALHTESLDIFRELGDREGVARSLANLGNVAHGECDYAAARALLEESLVIRRELGDRARLADTLNNLGTLAYDRGDYVAARALYSECLAIRREFGDRWNIAIALNNLGGVADSEADYAGARPLYEESLAIFRELGDRWGIPSVLSNLGELANGRGDYATARTYYAESLAIRRESGDRRGIAAGLNDLASVARALHDPDQAIALTDESLVILRDLRDLRGIADALELLAEIALDRGDRARAIRIWSAAERLRIDVGVPLRPKEQPGYDRTIAAVRAAWGDDAAFERAVAQGRAMTVEQAIDDGLGANG
jgi:predicted ATPase/class 3 adenylate cyclase